MEDRRKREIKRIAIVAAGVVLCVCVFFIRLPRMGGEKPFLVSACDAMTAVGLAFVFWGFVLFAISKGGLDGLFYITHNVVRLIKGPKKNKYVSFYDFVHDRERKPSSFRVFLCFGAIAFALGMILLAIMYL
ncbi:MAG: DUF3899 domain-containing protein [Oscillospiraceae bacterium]|nr:DUF3899 domain-containing protein [Oscillospiraceae bacterium]